MSQSNSSSSTRGRKKMVDLKAISGLLDQPPSANSSSADTLGSTPDENAIYHPNEGLLQETSRIKGQRDTLHQRIQKMADNKDKVSKSVFEKVNKDYLLQLEAINKALFEKKDLIQSELKNLYNLRDKLNGEISRHQEILEEAQFRHFLEEYTEAQYKEVEEQEGKEISKLQSDLAQINSFTRMHEELFDPEDLKEEVSPPVKNEEAPPQQIEEPKPAAEPVIKQEMSSLEFELESLPPLPEEKEEEKEEHEHTPPLGEKVSDEEEEEISATHVEKPQEPDSIYEVLESIPTPSEDEINKTQIRISSVTPTPGFATNSETILAQFKLVFTDTDGNGEMKEFLLKDNTSIGRSPSNDLVLNAAKVSRQHAAINKYKDQYLIIDLKSSNGVFVNSKKVDEHSLQENDEISIGGYKMIFTKI